MRQTFRADPSSRWHAGRGRAALLTGGAIVLVLALCNVAALLARDALQYEDPAYRQPPQWRLFERLLYHPRVRSLPIEGGASALDDLLSDVTGAGATDTTAAPVVITSRPVFTATVARPYRYRVRAGDAADLRFNIQGPAGMMVDTDGTVTWTPDPAQVGPQNVTVQALRTDGTGAQQSFSVITSARYHPLGTDERGRDLAAALVLGTRWTILPGLVAVVVALALGTMLGGWAGYYGGRLDATLSYLTRVTEAFPALVLLFLAAAIFQFRLYPIMAVLGVILMPGVARDVRARVQALKARQFVEAAQELGLRDRRILWHDIVWFNARSLLLRRAFYGMALAVAVEVTLSYLRIGIQPPTVSWGTLIFSGRDLLSSFGYWLIFFPALATVVAVLGYYLLGRGVDQVTRLPAS